MSLIIIDSLPCSFNWWQLWDYRKALEVKLRKWKEQGTTMT